jgi:hypothetical protein
MSEELKTCPFCNGSARIESNHDWHHLRVNHEGWCILDGHDISYAATPDDREALVADWNGREG